MSLPRQVLPGRSYLLTRRVTQRLMLMRPDSRTNEAFIYCLAVAAEKYDIDVLFTVAMSNHHHTGIYDKHGNYPEFTAYFHKLYAKCMNAHRGRWENFWSSEQASVVRLSSPEDVLHKLVYTVCNPVKAHLVDRALEWPGVNSLRAMLGVGELTAKRPEHFFRPNGPMPEEASVRFVRPPGFEELSDAAWKALLLGRVTDKEAEQRKRRSQTNVRIAGFRKVLNQHWWQRPKSNEPRRKLSPRVASKNKWRRIEALLQNREFLRAYRAAWRALKTATECVEFPPGTYQLARLSAVTVASE